MDNNKELDLEGKVCCAEALEIKNEYTRIRTEDTPDLWSRIEAGVKAQSAAQAAEPISFEKAPKATKASKPAKKKSLKWIPITAGIVAAVIIGVIAIPLALSVGGAKSAAREDAYYMAETGAYKADGFQVGYSEEYEVAEMVPETTAAAMGWEKAEANATTEKPAMTSQKLIRTLNYDVETLDFDGFSKFISEKTTALGGYVESSSQQERFNKLRNGSWTLRIPAESLDSFIGDFAANCNITYQTENVEDITLRYSDIESHVEALEVERDRLLEILEQAETVSEILEIENQLTYIRYEIESYKSSLKVYDNKVTYCTVYIDCTEVREETVTAEQTFWEKISSGFKSSLEDAGENFADFFSWVIRNLPHILAWGWILSSVAFAIIFPIVKPWRKKNTEE